MPNWVYNSLTITGDKEQINKLKEQVGKSFTVPFEKFDFETREYSVVYTTHDNPVFAFWNIIAPTDLEEYPKQPPRLRDASANSILKNLGASNDWYNWNLRNWGTKWDVANDSTIGTDINNPDNLVYLFDTAWSPPVDAIQKLSEQYPELEMEMRYEEEQGWGGELLFNDGGYSVIKEWDIPSSHADYMEHDMVDSCLCAHEDDPDDWYDDCPRNSE